MPNRQVNVTIQEGLPSSLSEKLLRSAALAALDAALPDQDCQLTLALCDDNTIRALNAQYRGTDTVTDVLAFSTSHSGPWQVHDDAEPATDESDAAFPTPPNEPPDLGDVLVCFPQALRQAVAAHHSVQRESALLVIHGVLHLLGHDHYGKQEKALMWSLQDQALTTLFHPTNP